MMKKSACFILGVAWSASAYAQPTIDGTADASYGAALAVQNTSTQFGDSNLGLIDFANGSELDAAHAVVVDGVLYLALPGNLESNYNHVDLFFDTLAGGQNKLRGDNPDVDFNNLNRMGDDGTDNGLTFDAGFEADYFMTVAGGDDGTGQYGLFANWAELLTDGGGIGRYLGQGTAGSDGVLLGGDNPDGILATIDNGNTAGVIGGNGVDDGSGVTTGLEFAIPLTSLGNPTGAIKVCAFVNGLSHDFLSNQILGGLGGGDNLGEPRVVNFANLPGDQFFTVGGGDECDENANCTGDEKVKKAKCKVKNGAVKKVTVQLSGATDGVVYTIELDSGQCADTKPAASGKAKATFKGGNAPGCGANGANACGTSKAFICEC